jgi:uncharacterized protein (TIGR03435 family)
MTPSVPVAWTARLAVILLVFELAAFAQRTFEVASIKENKTLADGGSMQLMPSGGIRARHVSARSLITIAYHLDGFQLIGAPQWIPDEYYDVNATADGSATREQTFAMLQALLVDRFKLAFHRETRELDGFALVQARIGTLGPSLRRSTVDCEKMFSTTPRCKEGEITSNTMKAIGVPIWSVLQLIISEVGAPVSDASQLSGTFDVDFRWSNDLAPSDDLRPIPTALQEQLGLKLEKRRVPVEVFIVDHIEHPTPD